MSSSFDLNRQQQHIESKIVVALERISEAFRVLLWTESKQNGLSPIQIQILIFVMYHTVDKCKVSYLAQEFNMTKATISDSIKVLLEKGFIQKISDAADTRSFSISLTDSGIAAARASSIFAQRIEKPLDVLPQHQKEAMLSGLLHLIKELNLSGVITIQRMCGTCANFRVDNDQPYCALLQMKLKSDDLRIDCPEHELSPKLL